MAQSIIVNTLIAAGGRAFNVALGIIALGLVSRYLGVSQFGAYASLLAFGAIVQIFADAGLYLTLTRSISEQPHAESRLLSQILSLRLALLLASFAAGALVVVLLPPFQSLLPVYFILSVGFIAQSLSQLLMGLYQKYAVVWRATAGDLLGRLAQIGGLLLLGASGVSLTAVAALFSLSTVAALGLHRLLLPAVIKISPAISWSAWKRILLATAPLAALLALNVIHFRLDMVLLSILRSPDESGLYGVGYRLVESILFVPAMFGGLLLPRLTSAWHQRLVPLFRQYFSEGLLFVSWVAGFTSLSFYFLAAPIITLISGDSFLSAAGPLRLLSLSLLPLFLGNVGGFALVAARRQRALLSIALVSTLVNLGLNLILIPRWGMYAAAGTTVLTELIAAAAVLAAAHRLTRLRLNWPLLFRLAVCLFASLLYYLAAPAGWPLFVHLAAASSIYLAFSWWLKVVSRASLSSLLNKA